MSFYTFGFNSYAGPGSGEPIIETVVVVAQQEVEVSTPEEPVKVSPPSPPLVGVHIDSIGVDVYARNIQQ